MILSRLFFCYSLTKAEDWPAKWNPWQCPSTCTADSFPDYSCSYRPPNTNNVPTQCNTMDSGNCQDVGSAGCCYVCPCGNLPIINCAKNVNEFSGSACYGSDGVCGCSSSRMETKIDQGEDLTMDNASAECSLTGVNSESQLFDQVTESKNCAEGLKECIDNLQPAAGESKMECSDGKDGWATLSGVQQHMTYHIETKVNEGTVPSNDLGFQYFMELVSIGNRVDGSFTEIDARLNSMKQHQTTLIKILNELKAIQINGCDDKTCKCEDPKEWDDQLKECVCPNGQIEDENGICLRCEDNEQVLHQGECTNCSDINEDWHWDPETEGCSGYQFFTETVLVIGGMGFPTQTDALLFCPEDDGQVSVEYSVVDNAEDPPIDLLFFSTAVRMDYPTNFTKLNFGGSQSLKRVASIADKDRFGNNEALAMMPMEDILNDLDADLDTIDRWTIPISQNINQDCKVCDGSCDCTKEMGKNHHRGVTCRAGGCAGRNYLLGGFIKESVSSQSVLEWDQNGFFNVEVDFNGDVVTPWNSTLYMNVARSDFGAVATSSYNKYCVGIMVLGGLTTYTGLQKVYTDSVECFDGNSWTQIANYDLLGYGHYDFDMVAVRNDDLQTEDLYITGGIRVKSSGGQSESNEISKLTSSGWHNLSAKLKQARRGHRSWVSYGLQFGQEAGDFDKPMIFSVAGTGGKLELEYFDVATLTSVAPYGTKGLYENRYALDIMVFAHNEFDLDQLPSYEEHCEEVKK